MCFEARRRVALLPPPPLQLPVSRGQCRPHPWTPGCRRAGGNILEHFSKAAFIIDRTSDYRALSPADLARPPIGLVEIPLPPTTGKQGLEFEVECSDGKIEDVVVINIASQEGAKPMTRRRASAWRLDDHLQAVEIKPAGRVKCPVAQAGY